MNINQLKILFRSMNHRDARKAFLLSMMVSVLMLVSLPSYANTGPSTLIQTIANNMLAGLKANKATLKTKPQVVYHLAYKYIVPYAALSEMAKHVLPPSIWNSATPAQRTQFEREFTTTLIRTYASSLTAYQDQTIQVFPVRGGYDGQRTVEVNSEIDSPTSQSIQVSYRLIRMGSEWKLYDLSVEGVSMLESFRAQFADLLSQGNMEQLLNQMSHHNNR